jgi:membrane peptidoglycan carboxypeptidase
MASYPAFDPNEFERYAASSWRNRTIMDAYEPGSTFKIVTAAAALESGLVHADDPFDCGMGSIVLYGITIRDHKRYGILSFADVIAKSSNVGVIRAAMIIGSERLHRTIVAFGFGRATGIDLPGENAGILHPLERWGPLTKAYVAFGQGVAVTPLQLATAVAAVANGGSLLQPYVVDAVRRGEVVERRHPRPLVASRPISAATAEEVKRLLERVVTDGTGKTAAVAGYRVAGKTGTAQIPVAGGYARHAYLPSFVGFAPADRPSLVGIVAVEAPQGMEYYGTQVAAPVFGTLVREVMLYLGVRPQRQAPSVWPGEVVTAGLRDGGTAAPPPAAPAVGAVVPAVAVATGATAAVPAAVNRSTASSGAARLAAITAVAKAAAGPAAAAPAGASPAGPAGSKGAAVVAADDDDAAGEDVPELWHSQPAAPPRPTARVPTSSPPPGPAGDLLDAVL